MKKTTIQYFCDRCGKEIILGEYQTNIRALKSGWCDIQENRFNEHAHGSYILCDECASLLNDFLEMGAKEAIDLDT